MKYLDKFLKILKTDRNTFFTYILTVISVYIVIDRVCELIFMFLTGISVSYWGPIQYTFALACPVFAFLFSGSSKFITSRNIKLTLFYIYYIALYIIAISMFVQWINAFLWILLINVPNYLEIVTNFSYLIKPAFQSIAIYIPLMTAYPVVFKFLYCTVNDSLDLQKSIYDYSGIDLSDKSKGWGPYTCECTICENKDTGKPAKVPEIRRFESTLIVGASGTGKTTMIIEPLIARDLAKKYFFKEMAKEMGFTALKTGIATLNCPYTNDYINDNFSLGMLKPSDGKEKLYNAYISKLTYSDNSNNYVYKDLGITHMSPDYESTSHILDVAKNYNIPVNLIDPANPNSVGFNPFIYDDPIQTAIAISSVLKGMHNSTQDMELAFRENATSQAIENLSILLKEMYPKLHNGLLPTLEDMLDMLNDFSLVENMCKQLETSDDLAKKYKLQLNYFKKYFYSNGSGKEDTEKFVAAAASELDNLLRISGVRNILCNRNNNINYDRALANGEVTLFCTRRGDLGAKTHRAFGLFFLLVMQYSVLRRPGNEKTRIPHFLYIDEFPDFICSSTESIFTLYRKYRVGTIISAQNLSQLGEPKSKYRDTILANCVTKIAFGNNTPDDNDWWSRELGDHREWKFSNNYKTDKGAYDPSLNGIKWDWKTNIPSGELQALALKNCVIKTKDMKGKNVFIKGKVDFIEAKHKEPHLPKTYNFTKFTKGIYEDSNEETYKHKSKFNPKKITFESENDEIDPIQTNTTDSNYLFNNEDAIIFDLKNNKNNSNN